MIKIIFENEHFVVCDKPGQVLSVPDRFKSDRPCLGIELQRELQTQIFPVHRLDFEVSGIILYAKTARAHKDSQNWFEKKTITKKYRALTFEQNFSHWPENVSHPQDVIAFKEKQAFLWEMKIQRGKRRSFESAQGDFAKTKAVMRSLNQKIITWDMYPITGRGHQLRLELSRHGFAILGDQLYGGEPLHDQTLWPYEGICLRAEALYFSEQAQKQYDLPGSILIDA